MCSKCYSKFWRSRNRGREAVTFNNKVRRADCHPGQPHYGRGLCAACSQREWFAKNRWKINARSLGVDFAAVLELLEANDGKCHACDTVPDSTKPQNGLQIDHCHETGHVRGLLCGNCNKSLGLVGDSIERVRQLLAYLERTAQAPLV